MGSQQADVIVVAAGLSGLAAAISAAENGAKVVAFEKASTTGGAGNMGMGPMGVGSRFQKRHMISITPGEAFRKHMNFTHWRADPRLVREIYFRSGGTIDWLEDMGVEFLRASRVYPVPERLRAYATSEETWHVVKPADGSTHLQRTTATAMVAVMTRRAKDLGVQFRFRTPVRSLLREQGRVVAVLAGDENGEEIEARAKAVIVATGGAGDSPKMIKEHTGLEWGNDLFSIRVPGAHGDGLRMAWEVGALKTEVTLEMMYTAPEHLATPDNFIIDGAFRQPCLWVNAKGERFMNEDALANATFVGNAILGQPRKYVFSIFDSKLLAHYKRDGSDITSHVHPPDTFARFDEAVHRALEGGYRHVFVADTIAELAERLEIVPASLGQTVEEYNALCRAGFDEIFEKEHAFMQPIAEPRFYACRFVPSAFGTLGGIKINHKAEVLDRNHDPIPGLYAAGLDACTVYGDSYPFILPGNTMGFALNSGRIAGENAARA